MTTDNGTGSGAPVGAGSGNIDTQVAARRCKRSRAWNRERWREHVAACAESGLTGAAYCRQHGLNPKCFYRWRGIFAEVAEEEHDGGNGAASSDSSRPLFAEVRVEAGCVGALAGGVEVVLAGERRVRVPRGFDAPTLAAVVRVLEGLSC